MLGRLLKAVKGKWWWSVCHDCIVASRGSCIISHDAVPYLSTSSFLMLYPPLLVIRVAVHEAEEKRVLSWSSKECGF